MGQFIAMRIKKKSDIAVEDGQDLYRKFFVNTKIYRRWKPEVDAILRKDGYEQAIVEK